MGLIERIKGLIRRPKAITRGLDLAHMGLKEGYHGISLAYADSETRKFLEDIEKAADESFHIIQRVVYQNNNPLSIVLIGRDYSMPDKLSHDLNGILASNEDLILYDVKHNEGKLEEEFKGRVSAVKLNGIRSTVKTPVEDYEIYGPFGGTSSEQDSYVSKSLINYAKSGKFNHIFQHCMRGSTRISSGVYDEEAKGMMYFRTIASEVETSGLNYAVLMPREVSERTQEVYEEILKESASEEIGSKVGKFYPSV